MRHQTWNEGYETRRPEGPQKGSQAETLESWLGNNMIEQARASYTMPDLSTEPVSEVVCEGSQEVV